MPPRPPHPVPNVDDVRNAPLWDGTVRISELIWVRPEEKYFCKRGWTSHFGKHEVICPSGKISRPVRRRRAKAEAVTRLFIVGESRITFASPFYGFWRSLSSWSPYSAAHQLGGGAITFRNN